MELKNKKVLLVGLGILGGGLSIAKYLLEKDAKIKITDLKTKEELTEMIQKLPKDTEYTLGKHKEEDFRWADIVVFNPAVSYFSEWPQFCLKNQIEFYNDYTFFLRVIKKTNPNSLIIGVTGTRGKTTISTWTNALIPDSTLAGNIPEKNLFSVLDKKTDIYVLELSSFQLEYATDEKSPNIAIFTNLYVDHLNRYKNLERYKEVKFNIFKNQTANDILILDADENIKNEILKLQLKSKVYYVSEKKLDKKVSGMFFSGNEIYLQNTAGTTKVTEKTNLAPHEKTNLLFSMLAAHLAGVEGVEIEKRTKNLTNPKFRQELIFKDEKFEIYNDSAGTSPEATIAAIEKFKDRDNFVLITGGTNKELDSRDLAKKIAKEIKPENLFLLEGSATDLLIKNLNQNELVAYENLEDIIDIASQEFESATIVFSPGAASFEKYKNEFDRGEKFNNLIEKYFN